MKKILYTAAILMCFTSKCMINQQEELSKKRNIEVIKQNIEAIKQNIKQNNNITRSTSFIMYDNCFQTVYYYNIYHSYKMHSSMLSIYFSKTQCEKCAMLIANQYFLTRTDKINPTHFNTIYQNMLEKNQLLQTENRKMTIEDTLGKNHPELMKISLFNEKLKNLIIEDSEKRSLSQYFSEEEFCTQGVLKKVINKLADQNPQNMKIIDELLAEYCNLKNYYFYGFNSIYTNSLDELNEGQKAGLQSERRFEIGRFFIDIIDIIEKDSEVGYIFEKYIPTTIALQYTFKAAICNKLQLAEKFAKKTTDYDMLFGIKYADFLALVKSQETLDKTFNNSIVFLNDPRKAPSYIKKEYITPIKIALSAIKERSLTTAYYFLKMLDPIIDLNKKFIYENKKHTFASYYAKCRYNNRRYFVKYNNTWKMLNTNSNEELEKLICKNIKLPYIKNNCKLQCDKEITSMLLSTKNFDILRSFLEEIAQYKPLDILNKVYKIDGRFYTFFSKLTKDIVKKHFPNIENTGYDKNATETKFFKSLTKNNFNMFIPNLKTLNITYKDINLIQTIKGKENNYAAVKNFKKYFLNDLKKYQTRNKTRLRAGSKLCVDIINKMLEIQEEFY